MSDITERCENCEHCVRTKTLQDGKWIWFHICDIFAHEKDGWAITVTPEDRCEMFVRKENKNDNFQKKV